MECAGIFVRTGELFVEFEEHLDDPKLQDTFTQEATDDIVYTGTRSSLSSAKMASEG